MSPEPVEANTHVRIAESGCCGYLGERLTLDDELEDLPVDRSQLSRGILQEVPQLYRSARISLLLVAFGSLIER